MIKSNRFFMLFLCAGLMVTHIPQSGADQADQYEDKVANTAVIEAVQSQVPCSYGQKINEKALRMLSNFSFSAVEIPKNVINTTNDSNIVFGLTGGLAKGMINMMGRLGTSFVDLVTLPIPTKPVAQPFYVWDKFEQDTHYVDFLRSDNCPPSSETVIATPEAGPVQPSPAVAVPPRQTYDNTNHFKENTNRKLDTLFKQQMMK